MRPYVILNAAMTLDGKIATRTGNSDISNVKDVERVHMLRKELDGIMVGINTVLLDNPKLTAHKLPVREKFSNKIDNAKINPIRIVVDSNGKTPLDYNVLNSNAKTIIASSKMILKRKEYLLLLKEKADVFISGEDQADLKKLMEYLYDKGVKTLLLEGGSKLNFSMLKEGLVNEVKVCIAPIIVGGNQSKTLVGGEGFDLIENGIHLKLRNNYSLDECLVLEYLVENTNLS
ncbi:MAG: 2,5-diamino-6-(ribosylamino)-4(3H)-pyrimidinone 5'-phosphate reductase [Methanobrevibacter sp.]|jgi:2,5-diamino-6-(ribosylamino)-4(3H)-pyrimidinone 5'-phosphate reductase|nr:2,5-diamino-6-(ribosylamino)-4(3H)-pyrimidinone 5'-phosphate reductase [Methanobrevibacter sp.]